MNFKRYYNLMIKFNWKLAYPHLSAINSNINFSIVILYQHLEFHDYLIISFLKCSTHVFMFNLVTKFTQSSVKRVVFNRYIRKKIFLVTDLKGPKKRKEIEIVLYLHNTTFYNKLIFREKLVYNHTTQQIFTNRQFNVQDQICCRLFFGNVLLMSL